MTTIDKKSVVAAGEWFTEGVIKQIAGNLLFIFIAWIIIYWLAYGWYGFTGCMQDSTDKNSWNRSGMRVYTDNATGVQYLSTGQGLTPRLNADGTFRKEQDDHR